MTKKKKNISFDGMKGPYASKQIVKFHWLMVSCSFEIDGIEFPCPLTRICSFSTYKAKRTLIQANICECEGLTLTPQVQGNVLSRTLLG